MGDGVAVVSGGASSELIEDLNRGCGRVGLGWGDFICGGRAEGVVGMVSMHETRPVFRVRQDTPCNMRQRGDKAGHAYAKA